MQVRGVEIGIVLLVLFVWACAIALFFNRWGKIRMLLPYQPEYKRDQLKVPGTGATNTCHIHHSNQVISLHEKWFTALIVFFHFYLFNFIETMCLKLSILKNISNIF